MAKKDCPEGKTWDNLLWTCIKMRATPTPSPTLWICVILVTLGAILALTIWFITFRRQTKARKNDGKLKCCNSFISFVNRQLLFSHNELKIILKKVEYVEVNSTQKCCLPTKFVTLITLETPPFLFSPPRASLGSSLLRYRLFWFQHASVGGEHGFGVCRERGVADHRVPLPATELGGTALVTAKTV
uniref:Uncharacterized protein n=1 Tax=Xiphophorus maculatus TaxID=8083 RepID=A0A3B5PUW1_XIPMA